MPIISNNDAGSDNMSQSKMVGLDISETTQETISQDMR